MKTTPHGALNTPAVFMEVGNVYFEAFTDSGVPTWEIYKKTGDGTNGTLSSGGKARWLSMSVASAASTPVLVVAALFHFIFAWNDFLGPLLFLTRKDTYTLAIALQSYESQNGGVQCHFLMAASAVTILPVIVLFLLAQKTFIRGIATTGSKN